MPLQHTKKYYMISVQPYEEVNLIKMNLKKRCISLMTQ